eukprot:10388166-Lingulodinium_polyedra.AAC.1
MAAWGMPVGHAEPQEQAGGKRRAVAVEGAPGALTAEDVREGCVVALKLGLANAQANRLHAAVVLTTITINTDGKYAKAIKGVQKWYGAE